MLDYNKILMFPSFTGICWTETLSPNPTHVSCLFYDANGSLAFPCSEYCSLTHQLLLRSFTLKKKKKTFAELNFDLVYSAISKCSFNNCISFAQ